jgi:threonine/homoserine/homoserine lactone efflux protein
MFGIENFLVFVGSGIVLNLYPGQDTLYILARSISQGRLAGIFAALGINAGALFHTLLGALGLSALIMSSAEAFSLIKYAGAAYLIFQALLMFRASMQNRVTNQPLKTPASLLKIFRQGAITNMLNPKVALFFLAFIPQFIATSSDNKTLAFVVLGLVFIVNSTIWCVLLALFASFFTHRFRSNSNWSRWLLRINSGLFCYLGFRLALYPLQAETGH